MPKKLRQGTSSQPLPVNHGFLNQPQNNTFDILCCLVNHFGPSQPFYHYSLKKEVWANIDPSQPFWFQSTILTYGSRFKLILVLVNHFGSSQPFSLKRVDSSLFWSWSTILVSVNHTLSKNKIQPFFGPSQPFWFQSTIISQGSRFDLILVPVNHFGSSQPFPLKILGWS